MSRFDIGQRVQFISSSDPDPYTELMPGDIGTVTFIDDLGTVSVKWDSGKILGVISGVDFIKTVC